MTTPFRLGIAGLGTVGRGVVRIVAEHGAEIATRVGRPVEIVAVSARDRRRDRGVDLTAFAWEDDPVALARRADVDCVIEVMGGANGPAKALVDAALAAGKHVVTANKALLARHGQELAETAEGAGVALAGEAAVAGGIPALKGLGEGLAANRITRVFGVLNGTCNYILNEMEARKAPYEAVLADAQRLGYAEADPSFDVGGIDAAHKLAILAALAFGTRVDFEGVVTEGIERITLADIETARDMGFSIRLLGLARMHEAGLEQRVRPCMVDERSLIGALPGVTNAVVVEGDFVGQCAFSGPGAGEGPTASAIMADVLDIARGAVRPLFGRAATALASAPRLSHGDEHSPYYLRFTLADRPGALAQIASALGRQGVSIHRMRQYGKGDPVPVVIVTHDARRDAIDAALAEIGALPVSAEPPVAIRIEEV
ncbi:homoserine dehydrogenase [Limibaculum sp. M0105]|uniref:Homoserine dehydrogenase n=1 Tax=Thermohalobaculum xanthum TaxID=2753746 RepID=A0A8J7M7V3_9RHOB|nr:homoserine dehydrogenase [Thermohalobaculum xanthum]MBK0399330.1 homoserine dehydrogenase [Thermohalobaculum xanthum]